MTSMFSRFAATLFLSLLLILSFLFDPENMDPRCLGTLIGAILGQLVSRATGKWRRFRAPCNSCRSLGCRKAPHWNFEFGLDTPVKNLPRAQEAGSLLLRRATYYKPAKLGH